MFKTFFKYLILSSLLLMSGVATNCPQLIGDNHSSDESLKENELLTNISFVSEHSVRELIIQTTTPIHTPPVSDPIILMEVEEEEEESVENDSSKKHHSVINYFSSFLNFQIKEQLYQSREHFVFVDHVSAFSFHCGLYLAIGVFRI
jgi:hypothetical protein